MATASRTQILKALGVTPLRLRLRAAKGHAPVPEPAAFAASAAVITEKRIALLRSQLEVEQPALAALYTKITEAISAQGFQCVRMSDAANDPRVRVLVFGDAPLPTSVEPSRVLRADALAVLDADRSRKRALWELIQRLAREVG